MRRAGKSDAVRRMTRKDKRTAVVGVRLRMSAARKRRCGGRAVYCGKNERIRTGKASGGGKIRAAGGAAGRAEDTSGKRRAYFYRQIRRQIYVARAYEIRAERRIKSHARGSGEKTGRKRSVLTKTVAKKVSRG